MGRLGTSYRMEALLEGIKPRGWRSGWTGRWFGPSTVRVVAVNRSDLPEVREVASRILGGPAYAAHRDHNGTVYGRVATVEADTGFYVAATEHPDCLACLSNVMSAITHAAVTGSIGATYGSKQAVKPYHELEPDEMPVYEEHNVKMMRSGR